MTSHACSFCCCCCCFCFSHFCRSSFRCFSSCSVRLFYASSGLVGLLLFFLLLLLLLLLLWRQQTLRLARPVGAGAAGSVCAASAPPPRPLPRWTAKRRRCRPPPPPPRRRRRRRPCRAATEAKPMPKRSSRSTRSTGGLQRRTEERVHEDREHYEDTAPASAAR